VKHLPLTQETVNRNLRDRIRNLERANTGIERPKQLEILVGSYYGELATTTLADTPPDRVSVGGQLVAVVGDLATAGSTNTVVTIYVGGVSIGTLTIASSETQGEDYLGNIRIAAGSRIQCVITTAGTGAAGLAVKLRLKG
jgi:hypothetical protein